MIINQGEIRKAHVSQSILCDSVSSEISIFFPSRQKDISLSPFLYNLKYYVCVCTCTYLYVTATCRKHWTTLRNWFLPTIMWVLGHKFRQSNACLQVALPAEPSNNFLCLHNAFLSHFLLYQPSSFLKPLTYFHVSFVSVL